MDVDVRVDGVSPKLDGSHEEWFAVDVGQVSGEEATRCLVGDAGKDTEERAVPHERQAKTLWHGSLSIPTPQILR